MEKEINENGWHNVIEHRGDVPDSGRRVIVASDDDFMVAYYDSVTDEWMSDDNEFLWATDFFVIAWREINDDEE